MRTRALVVCTAVLAGLAVAGAAISTAAGAGTRPTPLHADLFGRNEIDAQGKKRAGDLDGRGSFTSIVEAGRLCFGITLAKVEDPLAAHIHRGTRGHNGPIVLTLAVPENGDAGATSACAEIQPALARAIRKNRRKFYVNVHSEAFPGGAVRGQLARVR